MSCSKHIFVAVLFLYLLLPFSLCAQDQRGLAVSISNTWGKYHALIIGIDAYHEWPRLRTAVNDAAELKKILVEQYGFKEKDVVLRTNQNANRLSLIQDLRFIASNLGENDNFLIYYAGHGQLDDLTGDGYWIPVEGKIKDTGTWISHSTIKNIISSEKVKGKNILVIADSCYSGSLLRGGPDLLSLADKRYQQKLMDLATLRSRQVITSGGLEPVVDGGRDGHSLFAYYLLRALEKNDHNLIDIENLIHSYVWKSVAEIGGQRPSIGRLKSPMDEDGQFVLVSSVPRGTQHTQEEIPPAAIAVKRTRSADEQYEILFWESIKDSNNLRMYKDYLNKFPNGTFTELARINIENLSAKEAVRQETPIKDETKKQMSESTVPAAVQTSAPTQTTPETTDTQSPSKADPGEKAGVVEKKPALQARVPPTPAKRTASAPGTEARLRLGYQIKLAIFPWKLTGSASRWNFIAIDGLTNAMRAKEEAIVPLYSYYKLETTPEPELLGDDYFSEAVRGQMWISQGSWSSEVPNVEVVCELGKQLGSDAIFISDINAKPWDPDLGNYRVFLIDVKTGKMYQGQSSVQDIEAKGEKNFEQLSGKVFNDLIQNYH